MRQRSTDQTGIRRPRLPRHLVILGVAALTACMPAMNSSHSPTEMQALAREALSRFDRLTPGPYPCGSGWAESLAGYVVAVAEWAERVGLHPGDRIVSVSGAPAAGSEERIRAYYQVPRGGPFVLGLLRRGRPITLSLPCRYQPELFSAERRTLEAASRGDWDACIAAAREARQLAGFTAYGSILREQACARAKQPSVASTAGKDLAALDYEVARMLLRDSRYVPGGAENVRDSINQTADDLRTLGFAAYADDLAMQLQAALAALPRLRLTWTDNSTDESGFIVERKIGQSGAYVHLARLPPNTVTYVDTGVEEGVTYCYRVKAFNASGSSDYTVEACATAKPAAPAGGSGLDAGGRHP